MSYVVVTMPKRLKTQSDIASIFKDFQYYNEIDTIYFDFSNCEYGEPFAMLYVAAFVRGLKRRFPEKKFVLKSNNETNYSNNFSGYAAHIGYFQSMGFDFGNPVGAARLSRRCFPIQILDIEEEKNKVCGEPIGSAIGRRSAELAELLTQTNTGDAFDLLQFSIREIARNAFEHSRGTCVMIFGQYWPKRGDAEIVIFDDGVGIFETLMDLEYVNVKDNRAALRVALMPGISGVSRGDRMKQDNDWRNSGFGLYIVSRYCGYFGRFEILSNNDYLKLEKNSQIDGKIPYLGTAISIHLKVGGVQNLQALHKRIVIEGEIMQSEIISLFGVDASAASKFLQKDFYFKPK